MPDKNDNNFRHQDWEPVVLKKTGKQLEMNKNIVPNKNYKANKNNTANKNISTKVLEDDIDNFEIKTVSRSLSVQIQQARIAKKITQKELAQKLNSQPSINQSYENCKAVPNGDF
jgi:ribosome-binding protein aMBF1 (putative translation factor)